MLVVKQEEQTYPTIRHKGHICVYSSFIYNYGTQ